ncbi:MAG: hypothetical protein NTW07_04995 [candidate division Zixibacteria bacterium]|nr:hypothetical protein [candidate division Zixibacteria bacterium]
MSSYWLLLTMTVLFLLPEITLAQGQSGIDPEALIERILAVDRAQRERIHDVTFDAEYVERDDGGNDDVKDKVRFDKKVYVKYLGDTAKYAEEYLAYYKNGELQNDETLRSEARDRIEKKRKRKSQDVSFPMLRPFYPEYRALYDIQYRGVADDRIDNMVCHLFRVTAKHPADSLINGDFYFEAENFHLVRVDFAPSMLVKSMMFKMSRLDMSLRYGMTPDGVWLPRQFDIRGSGKAMFFVAVSFAGTEYYRNAEINTGLNDSIFEAYHGN